MRVRIVSDGTDHGTRVTDVETGAVIHVRDYSIEHSLGTAMATLVVYAEVDIEAEVASIDREGTAALQKQPGSVPAPRAD